MKKDYTSNSKSCMEDEVYSWVGLGTSAKIVEPAGKLEPKGWTELGLGFQNQPPSVAHHSQPCLTPSLAQLVSPSPPTAVRRLPHHPNLYRVLSSRLKPPSRLRVPAWRSVGHHASPPSLVSVVSLAATLRHRSHCFRVMENGTKVHLSSV
ncbi:hypothetical protein PIB30_087538 [Stylosanthes scabra]|uniref:Uncharacterized protein n=1 Tax=Stylosanthes scabra TaxID=79078 RepID=A0ABU6SU11_9FABA|nr:hypothetical protein [Stylosanthes scabra]